MIVVVAFISSFPLYSQCDINIFQRGTISNGSVNLMPWLSYTSGCEISSECGQLSELVVWDMENADPCDNTIHKSNTFNGVVDVNSSAKGSDVMLAEGKGDSKYSLAMANGQSTRFKVIFKPEDGQSGEIENLIYNVRSITDNNQVFCDRVNKLDKDLVVNYSITILSRGRQMYMGLKTADSNWDQEIIDLGYISEGENLFTASDELELEIIFSNFTTSGEALLGLDNLIIEGKECLFNDNLKYNWSTGDTTERLYSVEKGSYCVTVTDCNGCQAVDCINVN